MTARTLLPILIAIFGLRESVLAAVPSVRLRTTLSSDQSSLTVLLSPDVSAAGCRYDIFSAEDKKLLAGNFKSARRVVTVDGAASRFALQTFRVPQLRKGDEKSTARRIFFATRTRCGRETKVSNVTSIRIALQKRSGEKSFRSWVQTLSKRLLPRLVTLDRAFPNLSFSAPVALENAGDGTDRLFVVQQGGQILVFQNDNAVPSATTFLDLSARITTGGERGLLGLAFHPNFETNGFFYVNYTDLSGNTVVSRFTRSLGDANSADPNSELILLGITQPFANHNGGALAFGLDGFLYISVGDGGSGGDPQGNGQNRGTLLGKILRIDVDHVSGGLNYSIPSENPYRGNVSGFREEIFAYGVRNPWRMSIDPLTGFLWAGDVGQNAYEEVDVISAGGNYGWNTMEGLHCYNPSSGCDQSGLTLPLAEYSHSVGNSITGGHVYRGSENPSLDGMYIYGDFISGVIFGLSQDGGRTQVNQLFATDHLISSFGIDESRELFLLSYGDGEIYRFSAN